MRPDLIGVSLHEATDNLKASNTEYRVIFEGRENIITADFHPNRVNLHVNSVGVIVNVDMG